MDASINHGTWREAGSQLDLVSFEAAREQTRRATIPMSAETLRLANAIGRVLAHAAHAADDVVPFARSAMDGFAVHAHDAQLLASLPIVGASVAGDPPACLRNGTAMRIATGAMLPQGANAVLPWEDAIEHGDCDRPTTNLIAGEHVFPAGDDARRGDVLAGSGDIITAGRAALLAAAGHATIAAVRRPLVRIVVTGDELVAADRTPQAGQIRDSNGVLLCALLAQDGARVGDVTLVGDEPRALKAAFEDAADADLVITTGGASFGPRDHVKPVIETIGGTFLFRSVALRPAKPTALARWRRQLILVLPGNPSAALVGYYAFAKPILARFLGLPEQRPLRALLDGNIIAKAARTYCVLATLHIDSVGQLRVAILPDQCSSLVGNAARADAMVLIPPGDRQYHQNDLVIVESFGSHVGAPAT